MRWVELGRPVDRGFADPRPKGALEAAERRDFVRLKEGVIGAELRERPDLPPGARAGGPVTTRHFRGPGDLREPEFFGPSRAEIS